MVDRTGVGDPARTLALLWRTREPPTRGPRPGLTVDAIVTTAVGVADAEGVPAVTIRRVAQALGVAPMSLYTYVPGKTELLDLMVDAVYAGMSRSGARARGWRAKVRALAADNWAMCEEHPWVPAIAVTRPPLGPGMLGKYEYELRAFADLGLTDVQMDAALSYVLGFVYSCARLRAEMAAAQRDTAQTEQQWWEAHEPLFARVVDESAYPYAVRVGAAAGAAYGGAYSAEHAYEFGLPLVLDGLAALIRRSSGRTVRHGAGVTQSSKRVG